jgi:UDP:flavonoid glycosyltransferase YjiC (YdhE family)
MASVTDLYTSPPLILATTTEPFEYPRSDWPSGLKFIGPMICDPAESHALVPDSSDPRPLVLVSGSTIPAGNSAAHWADTVLRALSSEPFRVVAMLPTERVGTETGAIHAASRLQSHSAILPHVSCVVCHGGAGTVHKALWFGVPVVAIPFALDRFEVARRIEVAGAGVALPLARLTPETLRAAVRRALQCREGAETVKGQFRAAGGPRLAADLVEARLTPAKDESRTPNADRCVETGAHGGAIAAARNSVAAEGRVL